jgi:hypothetical protein
MTLIIQDEYSLDFFNYNSSGATGALPIAAMIANKLIDNGILPRLNSSGISRCMP